MAWSDSIFNPKNWGKSSSTSNISSTKDAIGPSGNVSMDAIASAPKNTALQDIQMDLGIIPKNAAWYRDLADRQARSAAAIEAMEKNDKKSTPAPAPKEEAPVEEAPTTVAPETEVDSITANIDKLIAELEAGRKGQFDRTFVSGPSEEKAVTYEEKGRKSTIKTSPQGIVDEPKQRKSLLAGA